MSKRAFEVCEFSNPNVIPVSPAIALNGLGYGLPKASEFGAPLSIVKYCFIGLGATSTRPEALVIEESRAHDPNSTAHNAKTAYRAICCPNVTLRMITRCGAM